MVGGRGFVPGENEVNMALAPRQTGSSQKIFILAAALQAGATPDDVIDGRRPCVLPNPGDPSEPFEISDAVSREPDSLRAMTWYSINCAYARLAQIVGLNRVVHMTYAMAKSPYLYEGQPETDREPLQPFPALATGANPMSPLDMASGAQTIANEGLHMEPYYVEYIDDWRGERVYTHDDPGVQVLDRGVALQAVDVLKGVLTNGTGRRYPLNVPAAGKTGTQVNNTNAWFVGFTPQLTTAVWVGDPDAYTPMVNVPEFDQERVQGGLYPTQIWQAYMNNAHAFLPGNDWEAAARGAARPQRLYLPGNECIYVITGYDTVVDPNATAPPRRSRATGRLRQSAGAADDGAAGHHPARVRQRRCRAGVQPRRSGTTIPPNVLDPRAPINTVPLDYRIARADRRPPRTAAHRLGDRPARLTAEPISPSATAAEAGVGRARPHDPPDRRPDRPPAQAQRRHRGGRERPAPSSPATASGCRASCGR